MVPPTNLPYYMKDGSIKPISPVGGESRKKRNLKLFPEEDPTNDRIIGKYDLCFIFSNSTQPIQPNLYFFIAR